MEDTIKFMRGLILEKENIEDLLKAIYNITTGKNTRIQHRHISNARLDGDRLFIYYNYNPSSDTQRLDLITFLWKEETVGFGGIPHRLLSLNSLRTFRDIMKVNEVKFVDKPWIDL